MLADMPGRYGHARCLRASGPVAPISPPRASVWRMAEALTSFLKRLAHKTVGLCRSQHGCKCR